MSDKKEEDTEIDMRSYTEKRKRLKDLDREIKNIQEKDNQYWLFMFPSNTRTEVLDMFFRICPQESSLKLHP